jgi:response regulator RpfG family c-di-GMP phosphodiesterase/DNA-binding CsgD family transcriptional regulator
MSKPTILYLDDDPGNLLVFETAFFEFYTIHTTTEPEEAFQVLQTEPVEVIVSDQKMPKITGIEFLKLVKEQHPDVVSILVTAYSDLDVLIQSINQVGIFRFQSKPWKPNEFRLSIDQAVETFRLRRENQELIINLLETKRTLEESLNEVRELNKELTTSSLQLAQKKELLDSLKQQLDKVLGDFDRNKRDLQSLVSSINQQVGMDKYWENFLSVFERVHDDFFQVIKRRYPGLTTNEMRLCALLKLNFSSKDISNLMGISPHSVNVARYRLRKKLHLRNADKLEDLLASL